MDGGSGGDGACDIGAVFGGACEGDKGPDSCDDNLQCMCTNQCITEMLDCEGDAGFMAVLGDGYDDMMAGMAGFSAACEGVDAANGNCDMMPLMMSCAEVDGDEFAANPQAICGTVRPTTAEGYQPTAAPAASCTTDGAELDC